ncbi:MAG: cbb3-type cytochrome c oxidase subunit I [Chloroflexi bacterium]|nr:cbb3-type cytochrome c oxidase subunit I [Chloroflexota bacterium]
MKSSTGLSSANRNLVYSWLLYAISAAGIAGTMAFMVAMTRTPGVRLLPSARAFHVILVGHVTFALTIWLLAFISTVWMYIGVQTGLPMSRKAGWVGLAISLAGAAIISIPILLFQGEDVMTDYVPLLDTPLFFVGFVTFLGGIGITAANYLVAVVRRRAGTSPGPTLSITEYGMACAAVAALTALVALAVAALRLGIGANGRVPAEYYQAMFWGMGHSFQYVSVSTMVVVWFAVVGVFLGEPKINERFAKVLFSLFALFPLATPLPYFLYDAITVPTRKAWGISLDSGLSLPVMLLGPMLIVWAWRARSTRNVAWLKSMPWSEPRVMTFAFSVALFAFGLSIHPAARQGTLQTPAHYHSVVVGGVTLAFMGLAYHLLAKVDRQLIWRKLAAIQPYFFALGIMLLVAGLLGAGTLGAPRKTYDAAVTGAAWLQPMVIMGVGAGIAALGGAAFVAIMLKSLLHRTPTPAVAAKRPALVGVGGD